MKQPDISILSDQFLAEVRSLKYKNVAAELLIKLLGGEMRVRSKRNLVQSREFSVMLKKTLNAYHNRSIATQEIIEELIKLAKEMSAATQRGVDLGLNDDEIALTPSLPLSRVSTRAFACLSRTLAQWLDSTMRSQRTTAPSKQWAKTN